MRGVGSGGRGARSGYLSGGCPFTGSSFCLPLSVLLRKEELNKTCLVFISLFTRHIYGFYCCSFQFCQSLSNRGYVVFCLVAFLRWCLVGVLSCLPVFLSSCLPVKLCGVWLGVRGVWCVVGVFGLD